MLITSSGENAPSTHSFHETGASTITITEKYFFGLKRILHVHSNLAKILASSVTKMSVFFFSNSNIKKSKKSKGLQGWSPQTDQHPLLHPCYKVCPIVVAAASHWRRHTMEITSVKRNVGLWPKPRPEII